jgi:hypothetical protein
MRLLQICLTLSVVPAVWAQQNRPVATKAADARAPMTRSSFSANGLQNEKTFTNFFTGNFVEIPFDRENLPFLVMFQDYLEAYARHCAAFLPPNKVEMTRQVCVRESYQVNQYGARVGGSSCVEYQTVGTGLYADPTLYAAKANLDNSSALSVVKDTFKQLTQKNPLESALNTAKDAQVMADDMNRLFGLNACASPGLKRFQENIMLFSLNKQPAVLSGEGGVATARVQPSPGAPSKDQNYTRLVEDLILDQSKTWFMNRYVSGSTSNVAVSSRDAEGRPAKLVGRYLFNGRSQGSVTIEFSEGLPQCMYFFDLPTTCRTPNRRIVAAYSSGGYQQ